MRLTPFFRAAALLTLIGTGCPRSNTANSPAAVKPNADAMVSKLARILRAADRRVVDEELTALLSDPDALVRAKAVLALGQIAEPASLPDVDKIANDAAPGPRASAAYAMGLIGDPASGATLVRLTGDADAAVRAAAAEALGRIHEPAGSGPVGALLADPDMTVRVAAALAAWKFAEPDAHLDALIENTRVEDPRVRVAAAYALARLASIGVAPASSGAPVGHLSETGATRAREALAARVADPEPIVRMQVARGLASPRGAAELAVVGALTKDKDPGVRVNAVKSLGYPGISIKPYLDHAITDKDQSVARAALEAVGAAGGTIAVSELNEIVVKLDSGWLREAALLSLAKADPARVPDIVSGLLMNPDPVMRSAAAGLVAGRTEPGAVRPKLALLADPEPRVQALAIPIIGGQDGPVTKLLAGFFDSKDPVVRASVAEVVGDRLAHPRPAVESTDDLFARLEQIWAAASADSIPDAKLAVVDAAAKAGKDDRTAAVFTRALADPEVVVRRRAAAQFQTVYAQDKKHEIGPASDRPLADYERIVRFSLAAHSAVVTVQRPGTATAQFTIALDGQAAPMAAWNFSELAGKRFFDGATVHRVVPNFVVQDGDPRGDGYGGPGYSIRDEFNPLAFAPGVVGMASDGKDTAGSQWFVTVSPQPHLDGRYTSFGRVVTGLKEVVGQMRPGDTIVSIRVDAGATEAPTAAR